MEQNRCTHKSGKRMVEGEGWVIFLKTSPVQKNYVQINFPVDIIIIKKEEILGFLIYKNREFHKNERMQQVLWRLNSRFELLTSCFTDFIRLYKLRKILLLVWNFTNYIEFRLVVCSA